MTSPDFLIVGTTTKDLTPDGPTLGGTATYVALTTARLGLNTAIVTSVEPDVLNDQLLAGIPCANVPSNVMTTFRNVYDGTDRTQYVEAVASSMNYDHIPEKWRTAPLVLLGPLVNDVNENLAERLRADTGHKKGSQLIGASIQGWLRQWDTTGLVSQRRWLGAKVLPHLDVAFVSKEDVVDTDLIEQWAGIVPMLVVTMGLEGARVHHKGTWHHVAGYPAQEIDPTGAGDVFAAAFLVGFGETGDVVASARFANCAASFVIEGPGTSTLPTRSQIVERMRRSGESIK